MDKTKGLKRTVCLLLVMVMLAAELVTPVGTLLPLLRASASTVLEAVDEIDLSSTTEGALTDSSFTNYDDWKNSQTASVSVKEEDGEKFINVYDNDAAVAPAFQKTGLDMSTGIKTITFDLRVNAPGINATDASKNGAIFELKLDIDPENNMGSVYPDGSIELPAVPIIPVSLTTIRLYFGDTLSIQYGSSGEVSDTGVIVPEGEWAKVILVTTPADTFSLYYANEKMVENVSTIYGRDFSADTDLLVYSESATAGSDFDIKNYAIYSGDVSESFLPPPPIDTIDLSDKEIGLLTDTSMTNYNAWKDSEDRKVTVKEENGQKYLNVLDNSSTSYPAVQRHDVDFRTGVKTIAFDLRINSLGENDEVQIDLYDINKGGSWMRLMISEDEISYYLTSQAITKTGDSAIMNEWAKVIIVVDAEANTYSFFYGGKEVLYEVPPRDNVSFGLQLIDLEIRGSKAGDEIDFDIRNYRLYTGNQSYTLLSMEDPNAAVDVGNAGTKGIPGKANSTDLGLPYSDNYTWSDVDINTSAYDNYLAKRADLAASTTAAGGSANEVKVLEPVAVRGAVEVYVSPDGNDQNNGSKQQPLKTMQRAMAFVAELEADGAQGVVVYLREGTYQMERTISITAKHSGKNNIPVFISAYPNEKVVLTGGMDIAGSKFTAVTDEAVLKKLQDSVEDKIVAFDLKTLGLTEFGFISGYNASGGPNYSVQINGENLTLARYPNVDTIPLSGEILDVGPIYGEESDSTGTEFVMTDLRPLQWENDGNIWFKGNLFAEWRVHNQRVAEIREGTCSVKLEAETTGDGQYYNRGAETSDKNTHYYYNILEELDIPGEYYLDTTNGILYLYPTCDMSSATVTYTQMRKNLFDIKNAENVVLNGLNLENTSGTAIKMYNCKQVIVQNCNIQNVDQGVLISGEGSGVICSSIQYCAGYSVEFRDMHLSRNNFLQNCTISTSDVTEPKGHEIYVTGKGHVISHNLIRDSYNVSIYLDKATECVVEYNEVVGGPTGSNDSGAIYQYSGGETYNNHVRFNYIHDIGTKFDDTTDPWAIYFDDASCGSFAYGNIIQNTPGGLFTNSGSSHVFADNVVVNGRDGTVTGVNGSNNYAERTWADYATGNFASYQTALEQYKTDAEFRAELIIQSPAMARRLQMVWDDENEGGDGTGCLTAQYNCAINNIIANHGIIQFRGLTETHTILNNTVLDEDPFVDSANHDFTLKPGVTLSEGTVYVVPDMSRMGIIEYLTYGALHNLRLQDLTKIGYAFKMDTIDTDESVDAYGVLIWTDDVEGEVTVDTEGVQNKALTYDNGYYTTESDGVYAQRLDTVHYAKPYAKIGDRYIYGNVDVYSPLKYVQTILEGTNEKLKQLMIDLLNYGTYAQLYFAESNQGAAPEVLIHDILTEEQKVMNWSDNLKVETPAVTKDTAQTLETTWHGTNLNLLEAIQMNMAATGDIAGMYYWTEDAYNNAEVLNSENASGEAVIRIDGDYTIGGLTGIVAQSVSDVYYVCGYDESGNLGAIRADSVAAYATRLIEKSDSTEATVNMAKALLVYGNSAMNYFAQNG